jgi:hypothetical protein
MAAMRIACLVLLVFLAACGSTTPAGGPAQPSPARDVAREAAEAEAMFRALEDRLLHARRIAIKARLKSTGAFNTEFVGHLNITQDSARGIDGRVHMDFDGMLDATPADVLLIADGRGMGMNDRGGLKTPPQLIPALVRGLVRMGLLHNVARGATGETPDHGDGAQELTAWLTVDSFSFGPEETVGGRKMRQVNYRLLVDNQPQAEATLWIAADTGLPVQRRMTVHFDKGDMHVTESYGHFDVDD